MMIINKIKRKGILNTIGYVLCTPIYKVTKLIFIIFLKKTKVDNRMILFVSEPDFSDNAKEIYNYYKNNKKYSDYKFIWFIKNNLKVNNADNTIFIKSISKFHNGRTLKALYYTSKCGLILFTHSSPFTDISRKHNQLIINLWHGCGYKNTQKKEKTYIQKYPFDYALVPGNIFVDTKSSFWGCNKNQILTIGYPRYDLLKRSNEVTAKYVKKIKNKNKLILWMPTFRNTGNGYFPEENIKKSFDMPLLDSLKELDDLNDICKKLNILLCVKRHPMQLKYSCEKKIYSNIIFIDNNTLVENKIDLYSLLKYTDALITDYSSVAIDYLLLNKPIAFTLEDFENYSKTRGFVFDNPKKYMPGHHIYNFKDMEKYIEDIGNDKDLYKEDRQVIMNEVHNPCDNYCERIVNKIEEIMEEKSDEITKKDKK